MRIFADCYELISEVNRDVAEMGKRVHPNSMQNKVVKDLQEYSTLEILGYSYILMSLDKVEYLFLHDPRSAEWVKAELAERLTQDVNPGEAWRLRYDLWEQFLVRGRFDYTYSERLNGFDAIGRIIAEIRRNPDSRQLILSVWDRGDIQYIGGYRRVPCSIYYQFFVREGKIHVVYNQRSADVVAHFGNDVWLAYNLMKHIAYHTEYLPGYLHHTIGSLHVYQKDLETLKTAINTRL